MDRNIILPKQLDRPPPVALRKESVDRNRALAWKLTVYPMSLSARRAWIEIACLPACFVGVAVALRKESVDRNFGIEAN